MYKVGFDDKLYPPSKIITIVDVLGEEGIPATETLRGVGVSISQLQRSEMRVSLNQLIECYRNAINLSHNRHLAFHLGLKQRLSSYGLYGFAMLCCPDLRRTMDFAVRYQALAAPLCDIFFEERNRRAFWTLDPILHPKIDASMYNFAVEIQIAIHISLMRDMESSFVPLEITVTYPSTDCGITADLTACPVQFEQPQNQIIFDATWLDAKPGLGHRTTYPEMVALCDEHLADLLMRTGFAGKVRRILLQDLAHRPTFSDTAKALRTTTRTLRRQLDRQGTSFRQLSDELRVHLAVKYLRDTAMTNEDIAAALGFSDAANFRHAFCRWTGKSPNAFRRQENPGSVAVVARSRVNRGGRRHSVDGLGPTVPERAAARERG